MSRIQIGVAIGMFTVGLLGSGAYAQELEGITVEGARVVKERIGRSSTGAPINSISLAYKVSYSDLDLSTSAGSGALEKRVREAADAACKELDRLYPMSPPGGTQCAKTAVDKAMVDVREAVAASSKTP